MHKPLLGFVIFCAGILVGCVPANQNGAKGGQGPIDQSKVSNAAEPEINVETIFAAGQLLETQGLPARAMEQYTKALAKDPNHVPTLYRVGIIYSQVKDYPRAIATWDTYIKATNGSAIGYSNLGFCYELSGDTAKAEKAYLAGIAADPKSQPCHVNYGLMLARNGKMDEAKAELGKVLKPAEVHYDIASVLEQMGHTDEAKAEFQRALEIQPNMRDAKERLADLK